MQGSARDFARRTGFGVCVFFFVMNDGTKKSERKKGRALERSRTSKSACSVSEVRDIHI